MAWIDRLPLIPVPPAPEVDVLGAVDAGAPIDDSRKRRAKYRRLCRRMTEQAAVSLDGVEHRSFRGYHVDHIVPIAYGYRNGILPGLIGSAENLRIVPARANLDKGTALTQEAKDLLASWGLSRM